MSVKIKLKSKISSPIDFEINGESYSLKDFKSHFMTDDFCIHISALQPTDNPWKYNGIEFKLSNDLLIEGDYNLDFSQDRAIISIDAEFKLSPKSRFLSIVKNPNTKWAFSGFDISKEISPLNYQILLSGSNEHLKASQVLSGGSILNVSYEKNNRVFETKHHVLDVKVS